MAFDGKFGPDLPLAQAGFGYRTPFGVQLPPGSRVAAFVRSTGIQNLDDDSIRNNLVTTLSDALKRCRSGLGDTVFLLPGHSESVADALMLTNMVAGTKIIGVGRGSNMPTFRWTATGAQWPIAVADVTIAGLRLRLEGANGVVKGILVTGADCSMFGNDFEVASGATAKATIALEVGAGAARFELSNNRLRGTATHNVTDGVKVVSAVANVVISNNYMVFSATAGNGNVHVTAAATEMVVTKNLFFNTHTASTACFAVDAVAATGILSDNRYATINDGVATAQGATFGAGALFRCFENYSCDEPVKSGVLTPGAVAT